MLTWLLLLLPILRSHHYQPCVHVLEHSVNFCITMAQMVYGFVELDVLSGGDTGADLSNREWKEMARWIKV